jgi:predicted nucleic acid-binding protein
VTTLVDSSVLLDIVAPSEWRPWSEQQLAAAADAGDVAINQVIYAEIAVGFANRERLERALQGAGLVRTGLPWAAAWLVAQAFREYRKRGGSRATPLPDFFIGAHAAAAGLTLLTRDPQRVSTYFPEVTLIAPQRGRPPRRRG